jgi:hypothetical protein
MERIEAILREENNLDGFRDQNYGDEEDIAEESLMEEATVPGSRSEALSFDD